MDNYSELKKNIARGWNTWNTRSVLSYVLLPEGFAVNLGIKEYREGQYLKESLIGRFGENDEKIHPGPHSYDGSYTELNLKWKGIELLIQTASDGSDYVVLVTPFKNQKHPASLVVESGILWNRKGMLSLEDDCIKALLPGKEIRVYATNESAYEPNIPVQTPCLCVRLNGPMGVSTGRKRTVDEIKSIIDNKKSQHLKRKEEFGHLSEVYNALQSCMAWDTIYEPKKGRVVTTVSRLWNIGSGGYSLFCWDTYFASYMAAIDNKELAYSNAIEITMEKTEDGFVPNFATGNGFVSRDRSQPPVGSLAVREIYRRYKEKWLLEYLFDSLYIWNTWYLNNRQVKPGLMAWGSTPYTPLYDAYWESTGVNDTFGGALESGLDNSPMYDDIPFDREKHMMKLADVGLTGLYIMDCNALADIADIIGRKDETAELKARAKKFTDGLKELWDGGTGMFLNRRTDTCESIPRISPTNFYALFSSEVSNEQAERMLKEHYYNPEEFWGDYIMPSISRNDPAYPDQNYWRGRIWAPMNFLVYLGLRNHNLKGAMKDMAEKSVKLILKEWLELGHVHENYSGDTGEGCDKGNSDKFYHWGALLSLIGLMEAGYVEGPEKAIDEIE